MLVKQTLMAVLMTLVVSVAALATSAWPEASAYLLLVLTQAQSCIAQWQHA